MTLSPWRSPLSRALHRNRSAVDARYFQLATVDPEGYPTNRTVVFRGFAEPSDRLKIITDHRSGKIAHLAQKPWGAISWYFRKTREQFRLSGPIQMVESDTAEPALQKLRQQTWQQISSGARAQFAWPTPKAPQAEPAVFMVTADEAIAPATFVLLLLDPQTVDHLELHGEPQCRTLYEQQAGQWQTQTVNP